MPAAAAPAPAAPLSAQEQKYKTQYEAMLSGLQAELAKAIPAMAEDRKTALQRARNDVAKARAAAKTAQEALGKVGTAKALVDHANGKWLGGAAKGIAAAEAALFAAIPLAAPPSHLPLAWSTKAFAVPTLPKAS